MHALLAAALLCLPAHGTAGQRITVEAPLKQAQLVQLLRWLRPKLAPVVTIGLARGAAAS